MSLFSRLSDIIAGNINALLDKAENPERMIAQVIREMEAALGTAKRHAAMAIAAERRIGRELDQHRDQVDRWRDKARQALDRNREDWAKQALLRRHEHQDIVAGLEGQYAEALRHGGAVRTALKALEARLAEARRKQRFLLVRGRATQVRREIHQVLGAGLADFSASNSRFQHWESRLIDWDEEVTAALELDQEAETWQVEMVDSDKAHSIAEELAALKQELRQRNPKDHSG